MNAPVTIGTTALVFNCLGGKELVLKLLGPTADYLGTGLKTGVEKGWRNLSRIFRCATSKLGSRIDEPGTVSPRVVHLLLDQGFFCEDELAAEYLGGVLASSRVSDLRDDRGAYWLNVLGRLTTYQIRAHYIIYMKWRRIMAEPENLEFMGKRVRMILDQRQFIESLEIPQGQHPGDILEHIFTGLQREELIGDRFVENAGKEIGIEITRHGMVLLLWVYGLGSEVAASFYSQEMLPIEGVPIPRNGRLIQRQPGLSLK